MSIEIPAPPVTPRESVADVYHGERIEDPYRWLEDQHGERVRRWTEAQNARTRFVLDRIPQRAHLAARLRQLLAVGLLETPRPVAGRLFHVRREGEQKQAVLYVREGLGGRDRALIDPNAIDPSGLTALDWWYPSRDGAHVAYGLSHGGDEMSTLYVRGVSSGRDLVDTIPHTQRARVAWVEGGFYYTVHPEPGSVAPGDEHYYRRVRFHRLGDDPRSDPLVFGQGRPKEQILDVATSPDGRWVLLLAYEGWIRSEAYLLDREDPGRGPRVVVEGADGLTHGEPADDRLWLQTSLGSPNYRIVSADPLAPGDWTTVVPEGEHAIEGFCVTGDRIAVHTLEYSTSRLAIWTMDGRKERDIALPALGSIAGSGADIGLDADDQGVLVTYVFQSFAEPAVAFALDARGGEAREVVRLDRSADLPVPIPHPKRTVRGPAGRPQADLGWAAIALDQTSYRSRDGTEVPMFLVHRRDVAPDGRVPTILNGYGGFNISRTPLYSAIAVAWAEAGGLYAVANLRGGGEFGERWHRAGMLANKQNVFDDLHAAAQHLVASGWTSRDHLGIYGGSNGGLLVGAAMAQRPDLYGAVVCAVPLLDMLRYQQLLIARFWIAEYGSSEDPEQYRWLRAYSPYHNVRRDVRYPPILLTTAEGDSRVDPMHARKMAALLQASAGGPVLLRVDGDAGHGVGKPLAKQVDDAADLVAFLTWQVGKQKG